MSDRRGTAIHEAGHAVMACHLKIPFRYVTIDPGLAEGNNGGVIDAQCSVASIEQARDWLLFCWAGYAACAAADVHNVGYYDDSERSAEMVVRWWKKKDDRERIHAEGKARAVEKMRSPENQAAVQLLADLLLECETLCP